MIQPKPESKSEHTTPVRIDSVDKAVGLLQLLMLNANMGLSEISRRTGLNKSRCFRLLSTLEHHHFVERYGEPVRYRLGDAIRRWHTHQHDHAALIHFAQAEMTALHDQFNENTQLRVLDGQFTVSLRRLSSSRRLQIYTDAQDQIPLGRGASGKLFAAWQDNALNFLSATEQQAILAEHGSISHGEITEGAVGMAAAIILDDKILASLSLTVPEIRANSEQQQAILRALKVACARISQQLNLNPAI